MIASYEVNRISCSRVLLIKLLLQQISLQVIDDVRLVGDISPVQQIVFDLVFDNFLVDIGSLLLVDELPLIRARIEDL